MKLQFVKQGGEWVAEFEATSDFNINLDRTDKGYLLIYQKGAADGTWATYPSYKNYKEAANIDVDVTALIYPKYIKVVSQSEVEKAIVTMEGESGGSGTGGGLRPITAEDVILYKTNRFGEEEIPFSNTIAVPENYGLGIKIKDNKKSLFFTGRTVEIIIAFEGGELYSTGYFKQETTINIEDVYIKD